MKKQPNVQQRGSPKLQDGSLKILKKTLQTSDKTGRDKKGEGTNKHYQNLKEAIITDIMEIKTKLTNFVSISLKN